jgi:hypothetical protein
MDFFFIFKSLPETCFDAAYMPLFVSTLLVGFVGNAFYPLNWLGVLNREWLV